jgi:hypothetical protein
LTNTPYRLKIPPEAKHWPLHIKNVEWCDESAIRDAMSATERAQYDLISSFFEDTFLAGVPRTGPSIIELTPAQIQRLIDANLLERGTSLAKALRMHIFCVCEVSKCRWRLIVHTCDINDHEKEIPISITFTPLQHLIDSHLKTVSYVAQNDSASCYHQFRLSETARDYYAFEFPGFGILRLVTIATGQRQCVARAELLARCVLGQTTASMQRLEGTAGIETDTYIDNYKGASRNKSVARQFSRALSQTAARFNVTMNETADAAEKAVSQEFTFRGIEFFFPPDDKTTLLARPGSKTRKKLTEAWESFGEVHSWTFRHAESVFSLGVYASSVLGVATHPYYYVYKYVRRRHRLLAQGVISQNSLANVWPSIAALWRDWIKGLLDHEGRRHDASHHVGDHYIVVTDASHAGWGGMIFFRGRLLRTMSGGWEQYAGPGAPQRPHINVLEIMAARHTVAALPSGSSCSLYVDNTTVISAISKGRSRSYAVNQELSRLEVTGIRILDIHYVASAQNPADGISRGNQLSVTDLQLAVDILPAVQHGSDLELAEQRQNLTPISTVLASNSHAEFLTKVGRL